MAGFGAGRVWNKDATTAATKKDTLTSTGFGVRADFEGDVATEMFMAFPLNRGVQTFDNEEDPRFFFSVNKEF